MKKIKMFICFLLLGCFICGCSCKDEKIDVFADISNGEEKLTTNLGDVLTANQVYLMLREEKEDEGAKNILKKVIMQQIDMTNTDYLNLYKKLLNEYFEKTFVDSKSYNYFEEFDEKLVVKYLKEEGFAISCGGTYSSLLDAPFTCDYSNYIEEIDFDIYFRMLKIKYIIDVKPSLLDKNEGRRISSYSISRSSSSDYTTRETLEQNVESIVSNHDSDDETLIRSIVDIVNKKKKESITTIEEEFSKISSSSDTNFTYRNKYTTCGTKKCTLEEGKQYQIDLINDKEDIVNSIAIKSDTTVLYEAARKILFADNIEDYLYEIGTKKFLISPIYKNDSEKKSRDVILFDGSSTYYLVEVEIIDSTSSFADKADIAELFVSSVSDLDVVDYYFENVDIEIYDKEIREKFISLYGNYKED